MEESKLVRWIAAQTWIDGLADPVQGAVRGALDRAPLVAWVLRGGPLGHPLHPALVPLPIGAFATALVFDGLSFTGQRVYRRAADKAITLGVISAFVALAPGLADWSQTEGTAKRVGFAHASLNLAGVAVYGLSLVSRARNHRTTGVGLSLVGFGVLGVSAWLGGELAYRLIREQPATESRRREAMPQPHA
jgi:uncharacterized membrane protein